MYTTLEVPGKLQYLTNLKKLVLGQTLFPNGTLFIVASSWTAIQLFLQSDGKLIGFDPSPSSSDEGTVLPPRASAGHQ